MVHFITDMYCNIVILYSYRYNVTKVPLFLTWPVYVVYRDYYMLLDLNQYLIDTKCYWYHIRAINDYSFVIRVLSIGTTGFIKYSQW